MTAQGEDAAARPADVAEQELKDSGSANDLRALGMLRPADRITNRCRFLRT